jgi:hypothetical protein
MNINEVDKFRKDYFEKLIKAEKDKEKEIVLAQKNCFHYYNLMGIVTGNGYQQRTCSKCGHTDIKSIRTWESMSNKNCVIS